MILRRATSVDLPAIEAIVRDGYAPYIARLGRPPAPITADYAALINQASVTVASLEGHVAGVLVLLDQPDHLLLDNVVVAPSWQGRGLSRALLAHAEQVAASRGFQEIRLYTNEKMTENIAIYRRAGYVETGRGEQDGFARVFFRKVL